ncbi:MAG: heavy-metal-associated domain-containing protein [Actinomycetota bacterium]
MTTQLRVADATCGHCKATIEGAATKVEGVRSAELDLDSKVLNVSHDDALDVEALTGAITEAGYTPEAIS